MILNHKSNAQTDGKSPHRPGGIYFHYLLRGQEGAKDNFELMLVEAEEAYYTPRHRHNFEQVRIMLDGSFQFGPKAVQKKGSIGYFPEGAYYTQKGIGHSVTLILQVAGASGDGYMSHRQLRQGAAALEKIGEFNDGIYIWKDEKGRKRNKDGYEAAWEHVVGRKLVYPKPRYDGPIILHPENFSYTPVPDIPGAEIKELGRFNERALEIRQLRLKAGTKYSVDSTRKSFLFYADKGEGTANGEKWGRESAFQTEKGETVTVIAAVDSEFFVIGLPVFDD